MKLNVNHAGIKPYIISITKFINKFKLNKVQKTKNNKSISIFIHKNTMYQMTSMYEPIYGIIKDIKIYDIDKNKFIEDLNKFAEIIDCLDNNIALSFNYSCECSNKKRILILNTTNEKQLPLICKCNKCKNYSFMLETNDISKGYAYNMIEDNFSKIIKAIKEY